MRQHDGLRWVILQEATESNLLRITKKANRCDFIRNSPLNDHLSATATEGESNFMLSAQRDIVWLAELMPNGFRSRPCSRNERMRHAIVVRDVIPSSDSVSLFQAPSLLSPQLQNDVGPMGRCRKQGTLMKLAFVTSPPASFHVLSRGESYI